MDIPTISSSRASLAVDGDDVDVRYLHGGDGPPLVFHGIGLDAAAVSWRHAPPALADEFSVYALDLPGHGESDGIDRTYTTDYYVDVLAAFLEAAEIRGAGLVGISMGGAVAPATRSTAGRPSGWCSSTATGLVRMPTGARPRERGAANPLREHVPLGQRLLACGRSGQPPGTPRIDRARGAG